MTVMINDGKEELDGYEEGGIKPFYNGDQSLKSFFSGAETNCRIAHNLGILLMNSNCFVIFSAAF